VPACFSHCRKSQQQTSKKGGTSYIKKNVEGHLLEEKRRKGFLMK